jgi:hypothetical protein
MLLRHRGHRVDTRFDRSPTITVLWFSFLTQSWLREALSFVPGRPPPLAPSEGLARAEFVLSGLFSLQLALL